MSEARDEAERIVSGVYVHVQAVTSWVEDIEAWEDYVGRVVAALAAAIEVDAALQVWEGEENPLTAEELLVRPSRELREALSALRAGKETG